MEITYISKDNQKFIFTTSEMNKKKAIQKGYDKLKELNYDHYCYVFKSVK